jgi:hypothetical protein
MKVYDYLPFVVSVLALGACQRNDSGSANEDINGVKDPAYLLSRQQILETYSDVSCESLRNLVDYLDDIGSTDYFRGLSADLIYQPQSCRSSEGGWNNLDKFASSPLAVKSTSKIYLTKLDVPTRSFSLGFPKLDGSIIQTAEGADLVEYFSLRFRTELKLGDEDEEGEYEFAVLADDGVRMQVGEGSNSQVYLEHPSNTPSKMICSDQKTVTLSRDTVVPVKLDYFQGPRYHIALTLIWRKAGSPRDPLCGRVGNSLFFDSTKNPSLPQKAHADLIERGWNVVPAHVFRIPRDEYMNPCESDYIRDVVRQNDGPGGCTGTSCGNIGL